MSKASVNEKLNAEYKQIRFEAEQNLEDRLQAALQIPEFKALYVERKALALELSKKNTQELKDQYQKVSKKLLDLINNNKIDLNIYFKCKDCKDTGFINGKPCHCRLAMSKRLLKAESNLPSFANATFDKTNFTNIKSKQSEFMSKLYRFAEKWSKNIDSASKRIFFMMGNVGIGKTTLAFCIANELLSSGHSVYFATAFDLANLIIDKQFNRLQNIDNYYNMLDADLLIIDDLGTEPQNTIMQEGLFAILDSRINENKKTVICTNLDLKTFRERYGLRSASRLTCVDYAQAPEFIEGDDLRKIKC